MKPVPCFTNTDGQTFGSNGTSVFQKFGEKLSYYYYWSFPQRIFLNKVSAKYCTCVINMQSSWYEQDQGKRHTA